MNTGSVPEMLFRFHLLSRQVIFKCVNMKSDLGVEKNWNLSSSGKRKMLQPAFKLQKLTIKFRTRFYPE